MKKEETKIGQIISTNHGTYEVYNITDKCLYLQKVEMYLDFDNVTDDFKAPIAEYRNAWLRYNDDSVRLTLKDGEWYRKGFKIYGLDKTVGQYVDVSENFKDMPPIGTLIIDRKSSYGTHIKDINAYVIVAVKRNKITAQKAILTFRERPSSDFMKSHYVDGVKFGYFDVAGRKPGSIEIIVKRNASEWTSFEDIDGKDWKYYRMDTPCIDSNWNCCISAPAQYCEPGRIVEYKKDFYKVKECKGLDITLTPITKEIIETKSNSLVFETVTYKAVESVVDTARPEITISERDWGKYVNDDGTEYIRSDKGDGYYFRDTIKDNEHRKSQMFKPGDYLHSEDSIGLNYNDSVYRVLETKSNDRITVQPVKFNIMPTDEPDYIMFEPLDETISEPFEVVVEPAFYGTDQYDTFEAANAVVFIYPDGTERVADPVDCKHYRLCR